MSKLCHHCGSSLDEQSTTCSQCHQHSNEQDVEITQVITPAQESTEHTASVTQRNLSDFEVLDSVTGGFATILKARDPLLDRIVALKLVPKKHHQTDLVQEAKLASKLNHPNIVTIFEIIQSDEQLAIVMEWVEGDSLKTKLTEALSLNDKVSMALQLCNAIDYAHQHAILHCDIKPDNILFDKHNQLKVLDFGLSHVLGGANQAATIGSPAYLAPELYNGQQPSKQSDLFALGAVLFELFSGDKAFDGKSLEVIKAQITTGEVGDLANKETQLPEAIITHIQNLLVVEPSDRPQLSDLIDAFTDLNDALVQKPNWWQRRAPWQKVSLSAVFLGVMAVLLQPILFPPTNQQILEKRIAENKRIAVLPLQNINGDPQVQLFSQGLAVSLSTELGKVGREKTNSWVIPSAEVAKLKNLTVDDVHKRYGADLVLTGSIQHLGSNRLVNLELIDGASGVALKQRQFKVNTKALFASNQAVFAKAITMLNWPKSEMASKGTEFDGAYKHYIAAIGYTFRSDQKNYIDNAIEQFKQAIELDALFIEPYEGLGLAYRTKFHETKSEQWLLLYEQTIKQLAELAPNHAQVQYLAHSLAIRRGNAEKASKLLKVLVNENPENEFLHFELARAYQQLKEHTLAEQSYHTALNINAKNWKGLNLLGRLYYRTAQYDKAINTYQRLVVLTPKNAFAYTGLSASYYGKGKLESALVYAKEGNALNPTVRGYSNIGVFHFILGQYQDAISAYKQAIKLDKNDYMSWGNLADSYWLIEHPETNATYKQAADLAEKVFSINKQKSRAKLAWAYYKARLGDKANALEILNSLSHKENATEFYLAAQAYDALDESERALSKLKLAIAKGYPKEEAITSPLWKNWNEQQLRHISFN